MARETGRDAREPAAGDGLGALLDEVRRIEIQSRRLVAGVLAGGYSSVFRGSGIEFDQLREYVEGDDPRAVDWHVTARVHRPFVREYVDERELTVLFLLDRSASMDGGFGMLSARRMAARVVACLGLAAAGNNDRVGFVAFGDGVDAYVPPAKGRRHVLAIVRDALALPGEAWPPAAAAPPPRGGGLASALDLAGRVGRRHAIVFVVSDFLTSGWETALAPCARRHDVVAVRLLVPELAPPDAGPMRVRDPETGREDLVDWGSRRVREAYARRVADWRARTDRRLRRAGVDRIDVRVPRRGDARDAVARPILEFFAMRERRGAKR